MDTWWSRTGGRQKSYPSADRNRKGKQTFNKLEAHSEALVCDVMYSSINGELFLHIFSTLFISYQLKVAL